MNGLTQLDSVREPLEFTANRMKPVFFRTWFG